MSDAIIPVSSDSFDPSVHEPPSPPRFDHHPIVLPVSALIPPAIAAIPLRAIPPPPPAHPPVHGPPPEDFSSTGSSAVRASFQFTPHPIPYHEYQAIAMERNFLFGQIRELEHSMRTTDMGRGERDLRERIIIFRRIAAARLHGATSVYARPGDLAEWARWMLEELGDLGGPDFP